jgi:Tfp pilus assembly protein PilO
VITARDRKIISLLVPLLLVGCYWFLVLAPKRAESQKVTQELSKAQTARDTAEQRVAQLNAAKASFASDYAAVIRLGKAAPTTLDMPSLLLQLDRAARGTGIDIDNFKPGTVAGAAAANPTPNATSTPPGGGSNPASSSTPAQGMPAEQAQNAGKAVSGANSQEQGNADQANAVGSSAATPTTSAPGLVSVPLTFTVTGDYFGLSDFFHRMKRFVRVVNDQIVVRGRLMTVESFSFAKVDAQTKGLKADVTATIYLTPPSEGTSAGATPAGPAGSTGAASSSSAPSTPSSSPTPTATATP